MQLGYFQVIALPVSTWVQLTLRPRARAQRALGDEVEDAALALGIARIPVLDGRIFHLRILVRVDFDHRGVELVLVAHRRGAAFEIADVSALFGDDQRALELAGILGIDAEIGADSSIGQRTPSGTSTKVPSEKTALFKQAK